MNRTFNSSFLLSWPCHRVHSIKYLASSRLMWLYLQINTLTNVSDATTKTRGTCQLKKDQKLIHVYMYIKHLRTGWREEGASPVKVIVCRGLQKTRNRIKTLQPVPVPIFMRNSNYGDYFLLRKPIKPRGKKVGFCASWMDLPIYIFHWNYMHKLQKCTQCGHLHIYDYHIRTCFKHQHLHNKGTNSGYKPNVLLRYSISNNKCMLNDCICT